MWLCGLPLDKLLPSRIRRRQGPLHKEDDLSVIVTANNKCADRGQEAPCAAAPAAAQSAAALLAVLDHLPFPVTLILAEDTSTVLMQNPASVEEHGRLVGLAGGGPGFLHDHVFVMADEATRREAQDALAALASWRGLLRVPPPRVLTSGNALAEARETAQSCPGQPDQEFTISLSSGGRASGMASPPSSRPVPVSTPLAGAEAAALCSSQVPHSAQLVSNGTLPCLNTHAGPAHSPFFSRRGPPLSHDPSGGLASCVDGAYARSSCTVTTQRTSGVCTIAATEPLPSRSSTDALIRLEMRDGDDSSRISATPEPSGAGQRRRYSGATPPPPQAAASGGGCSGRCGSVDSLPRSQLASALGSGGGGEEGLEVSGDSRRCAGAGSGRVMAGSPGPGHLRGGQGSVHSSFTTPRGSAMGARSSVGGIMYDTGDPSSPYHLPRHPSRADSRRGAARAAADGAPSGAVSTARSHSQAHASRSHPAEQQRQLLSGLQTSAWSTLMRGPSGTPTSPHGAFGRGRSFRNMPVGPPASPSPDGRACPSGGGSASGAADVIPSATIAPDQDLSMTPRSHAQPAAAGLMTLAPCDSVDSYALPPSPIGAAAASQSPGGGSRQHSNAAVNALAGWAPPSSLGRPSDPLAVLSPTSSNTAASLRGIDSVIADSHNSLRCVAGGLAVPLSHSFGTNPGSGGGAAGSAMSAAGSGGAMTRLLGITLATVASRRRASSVIPSPLEPMLRYGGGGGGGGPDLTCRVSPPWNRRPSLPPMNGAAVASAPLEHSGIETGGEGAGRASPAIVDVQPPQQLGTPTRPILARSSAAAASVLPSIGNVVYDKRSHARPLHGSAAADAQLLSSGASSRPPSNLFLCLPEGTPYNSTEEEEEEEEERGGRDNRSLPSGSVSTQVAASMALQPAESQFLLQSMGEAVNFPSSQQTAAASFASSPKAAAQEAMEEPSLGAMYRPPASAQTSDDGEAVSPFCTPPTFARMPREHGRRSAAAQLKVDLALLHLPPSPASMLGTGAGPAGPSEAGASARRSPSGAFGGGRMGGGGDQTDAGSAAPFLGMAPGSARSNAAPSVGPMPDLLSSITLYSEHGRPRRDSWQMMTGSCGPGDELPAVHSHGPHEASQANLLDTATTLPSLALLPRHTGLSAATSTTPTASSPPSGAAAAARGGGWRHDGRGSATEGPGPASLAAFIGDSPASGAELRRDGVASLALSAPPLAALQLLSAQAPGPVPLCTAAAAAQVQAPTFDPLPRLPLWPPLGASLPVHPLAASAFRSSPVGQPHPAAPCTAHLLGPVASGLLAAAAARRASHDTRSRTFTRCNGSSTGMAVCPPAASAVPSGVGGVGGVVAAGCAFERVIEDSTFCDQPHEHVRPEPQWHEVSLTRFVHPELGKSVILVVQNDVSSRIWAERQLARVVEAEHTLLEGIFPHHVIQHIATASAEAAEDSAEGHALGPAGQGPAAGPVDPHLPAIRGDTFLHLATSHKALTVLFCDIQGFTPMCKEVPPMAVMAFLNDLFTRLDGLLGRYGVYKVETIGDCYVAAGGLMKEDEQTGAVTVRSDDVDPQHAYRTVQFAKALLRAAAGVTLPTTGQPVRLRVGIHSGPAMSGVVGTRMPRFCLFGDTMNTASRMESTGEPGAIHVSEATRDLVPGEAWLATGGVEVKGKGVMNTFLLRP